ncbi:hypothetical protein [Amycolatopsis thermoflava]|uniref:hypothetical protein n=1 Tax=Amycolatopsis thermoflava TaxID=84480 RepID=UPI003821862E
MTKPATLSMSTGSEPIHAEHWALRQVGWLGQSGTVYALGEKPRESGGFTPLYIQIGTYHQDPGSGRYLLDD